MFDNVKSPFILKLIVSNIKEELFLNIVKVSKKLQHKLNINILNYQLFQAKYKILDKNGKGKEYDYFDDHLLFEGEYLNGKRNGKGIEYDYGNIIFEGEYLNGKRKNGKEYDINSNLRYKGEYLNGKKWKGKIYHNNIIYGIINGQGHVKENIIII